MGTNIILRGLGRAENLKLYFHGERVVGLFTGVFGGKKSKTLLAGIKLLLGVWRGEKT